MEKSSCWLLQKSNRPQAGLRIREKTEYSGRADGKSEEELRPVRRCQATQGFKSKQWRRARLHSSAAVCFPAGALYILTPSWKMTPGLRRLRLTVRESPLRSTGDAADISVLSISAEFDH